MCKNFAKNQAFKVNIINFQIKINFFMMKCECNLKVFLLKKSKTSVKITNVNINKGD